jgi:hypothetical protein
MTRTPALAPAMRTGVGERRDSSGGAWCHRGERGPGAEGEELSHQRVRGGGSGAELARVCETEQEIIYFLFRNTAPGRTEPYHYRSNKV